MAPTIHIVTTPRCGASKGTEFNDPPPVEGLSAATINRIIIRHGGVIDSLEIYYSWNNGKGTTHGGTGGRRDELVFELDEFITSVEGRASKEHIVQLTFITNKRKLGPYGGAAGTMFTWGATEKTHSSLVPNTKLIAFSGRAGSFLNELQATFIEYREHTLKSVIYESTPTPAQPGSPPVSKFTSHLITPIVTVCVGQPEQRVEFHAHEDTLCQISFFKAALLGGFKEGLQKTINMPEDDPTKLSCLIEYLYTGNYTYAFDPTAVHFQEASKVPAGDLSEGLFHLGVYSVASKYICPGLVDIAMRNFWAVLGELGNIEKLRLWKAAYDEGIYLPRRKRDFQQYRSGEGLIGWVGGLFRENGEEMERTMSEYPMLACDLLRIATGLS